jgi:hypothetical protein
VRGTQRAHIVGDVFENVERDQAGMLARGRVGRIQPDHLDPLVAGEPLPQHGKAARIQIAHGNPGHSGSKPGAGIVAQPTAKLDRVRTKVWQGQ